MANLKLTISLPEDLAIKFVRAVPSNRRSRYIAELLEAKLLRDKEQMLIDACNALENDPDDLEVQRDLARLPDTLTEEWNGTIELPSAR